MLKRLTVSNLAVVEKAEVLFHPGLNVVTGETGAGKSVLMGAIGLVLGGRADATIVRDGATEAEVEAEFDNQIVRRTITNQGRSRAWIDDESVSIAELKTLGGQLVDIHGATANQRLMDEAFQRDVLDSFGQISRESDKIGYAAAWEELSRLRRELAELGDEASEDELELLRFQVGELEAAELSEDDDTLAERHAAAAHAEVIVENANQITEILGGDQSVAEMLVRLQPKFSGIVKYMPEASEWAEEAEEITIRVQELSRTVADRISRMDLGEENLDELDKRLSVVNRLKRKYNVGSVADLLQKLEEKKAKLDGFEHREEKLAELNRLIQSADKEVRKAGAVLTKVRTVAAAKITKLVSEHLHDLGFKQAKFYVELSTIEPEASGMDRVVYMFEPNPGEVARPLAAIASSGEIARVMLAIKAVLAVDGKSGPATLIFDEIDANIGGEVGRVVGEKMRKVAKHHQVIAITHLPQSAVFGEKHLVVSKSVSGGRTRTEISEVKDEARVAEIARMLGGEKLTSVVKKHAEELLQISR